MDTDDKPKYATPLAWNQWGHAKTWTTLDARIDQARQDYSRAVARVLDTHGTDPRQWPDRALDEIVICEARIAAVETLAKEAIRMGRMGGEFLVLDRDKKGKAA